MDGKVFALAEVSDHNKMKDCWLIINGKVSTFFQSPFQVLPFCDRYSVFFGFDLRDMFSACDWSDGLSEKLCTVVQSLDRFESEVHVSLIFLHDTQKIYIWFCWGGFWLYLLINVASKLIHFELLAYCGTVKLAFSVLWWLCITNLGARVDFVNNSICIITTMLLCMIGSTFIFLFNLRAYIVSLAHILTG